MKTLAEVLAQHRFLGWFGIPDDPADDDSPTTAYPLCVKCGRCDDWPAHVAAAWRAERTITTEAELDALPSDCSADGVLIKDANGFVFERQDPDHPHPWLRLDFIDYEPPELPVLVVYLPGEEQ